jgi:hypothetical protein
VSERVSLVCECAAIELCASECAFFVKVVLPCEKSSKRLGECDACDPPLMHDGREVDASQSVHGCTHHTSRAHSGHSSDKCAVQESLA